MGRLTVDDAVRGIDRFPGLRIRQVIHLTPGRTTGFVLSERPDTPGVLGLGTVDTDGEATAVGLNEAEVAALRDALTAWLEER
jgi:hypothetical protein